MKTDGRETNRSIEDQFGKQKIDTSRRSLTKAGVFAPVIMTLASKTALGSSYYCTISGMQSGNMSSHTGGYTCAVGFSPDEWRQYATLYSAVQPIGIDLWCKAGVNPFSIKMEDSAKKVFYRNEWRFGVDAVADWQNIHIKIDAIFGANASATTLNSVFGGSDNRSLWDVLDKDNGSLEWHAIADYLNAKLNEANGRFSAVYDDITPEYIVSIYNSALSDADKKAYFELIHH